MLILIRRSEQSILIDGDVKIYLLQLNDCFARQGIEAQINVDIWRNEIYQQVLKFINKYFSCNVGY